MHAGILGSIPSDSTTYADMMELVDIADLKSADREVVRVRIPLPAPLKPRGRNGQPSPNVEIQIVTCLGLLKNNLKNSKILAIIIL